MRFDWDILNLLSSLYVSQIITSKNVLNTLINFIMERFARLVKDKGIFYNLENLLIGCSKSKFIFITLFHFIKNHHLFTFYPYYIILLKIYNKNVEFSNYFNRKLFDLFLNKSYKTLIYKYTSMLLKVIIKMFFEQFDLIRSNCDIEIKKTNSILLRNVLKKNKVLYFNLDTFSNIQNNYNLDFTSLKTPLEMVTQRYYFQEIFTYYFSLKNRK